MYVGFLVTEFLFLNHEPGGHATVASVKPPGHHRIMDKELLRQKVTVLVVILVLIIVNRLNHIKSDYPPLPGLSSL